MSRYDTCERCGYSPVENTCEVTDCTSPAKYEGWIRVKDGFGIPTGLMQKRRVCEEHIGLTIAKEVK